MRNKLIGILLVASSTTAFATDSIIDQNKRNVNLNFGIDSTDLYSGKADFSHQDYNLRVGYNSTFPIIRNSGSTAHPLIQDFNLGQVLNKQNKDVCSTLMKSGKYDYVTFRGISSETVMFHFFHAESPYPAAPDIYVSKNRWRLNCKSPRDNYAFELTTPSGLTFLYDNNPEHGLDKYPSKVVDPNNNYINITSESASTVTLTTQYEAIKIDTDGIIRTDTSTVIAEFERNPDSLRVNYNEDSYWEYKTSNGDLTVCNPLKLCATYYYDPVRIGDKYENRIVKKKYAIPQVGTAEINYEYELDGNYLNVIAKEPYREIHYSYYKFDEDNYSNSWLNGTIRKETVYTLGGAILRQIDYSYDKEEGRTTGSIASKFTTRALLNKKTTKTYGDSGRYTSVYETYSYDDHDNVQRVGYSEGSAYFYIWDYSTPTYRVDLLKEEYLYGSTYKTSYTYFNSGDVKTVTRNKRTTQYEYYDDGSLKKEIDPAGNVTLYSNYKFGVAQNIVDAEGGVTTRTVENGYITSESFNGRKIFDKEFDIHGKLKEYQSGAANRLPTRYTYTYPSSGGLVVTTTTGNQRKIERYNGFGKVAQVTEEGGNRGSGNFSGRKRVFDYYLNGLEKRRTNFIGVDVTPTAAHYVVHEYDALGRLKKIDPMDEGPITFKYFRDTQITSTDANGVETVESYKYLGHYGYKLESRHTRGGASLVNAGAYGNSLYLTYYPTGRLKSVRLNNLKTEYTYNSFGDVETEESVQTGLIRYEYDAIGNVERKIINNNSELEIRYEYDNLGRITLTDYGDPSVNVGYTYDDTNLTETREKGSFTWVYQYNEEQQVVKETLTHNSKFEIPDFNKSFQILGTNLGPRYYDQRGTPPKVTGSYTETENKDLKENGTLEWEFEYTYNSVGALESITYPDGEVISYTPDLISQPTQAVPYITQVHYHPNGQIKNIHYANGLVSTYSIDSESGKLNTVSHGSFYSRQYKYDATGRLNQILDLDSSFGDSSRSFQFDSDYQLRKVYAGRTVGDGQLIGEYKYDSRGSLTELKENGEVTQIKYAYSPYQILSITENSTPQIFSITEDGRVQVYGNSEYHYSNDELMLGYSNSNSSTNVFLYDANHRKTKEILYNHPGSEYDPGTQEGNLLRYTIYNHNDQLLVEERADETWSNFVYLRGNLVAKRDAKYEVEYSSCMVDVDHGDRATYVYKYPIYVQVGTGVPMFLGECQIYDTWDHDIEVDEGTWQVDSASTRTYHVWIHQYEDGEKRGSFSEDFTLYKAFVRKKFTERRYSWEDVRRKYDCYNHWEIVVRKYNIEDSSYEEKTIKDGAYHTGRARYWWSWQEKPSWFSCGDPAVDMSKVSWPSNSSLMF